MAHSPQLQRFLDSLQQVPDPRLLAWNVSAVEALDDAERSVAEDALIDRAQRLEDVRAIKSLGLLGVKRAEAALRKLGQADSAITRNAADRALAVLTKDPAAIKSLVDAAGDHMDAFTAWDLKSVDSDEAFVGLLAALRSSDLPARMHALDGLASKCGVEDLRDPLQTPLGRHDLLLGSNLKSLYLPAADALADIFVQLKAGATPDALGLPYVPSDDPDAADAYWASAGITGAPYADHLLDAMGAHDLAWALALVVARVEEKDIRSLDTIEARGLRWALPVLEEMQRARATLDAAFVKRLDEVAAALAAG